jgi:hypothetical protein
MTGSPRRQQSGCEFVPSVSRPEPSLKRSEDEVRYGRLWAEVELPKLLAYKEPNREGDKQQ